MMMKKADNPMNRQRREPLHLRTAPRCRLHGGAVGSGAPSGARNGNYRHAEDDPRLRHRQRTGPAIVSRVPDPAGAAVGVPVWFLLVAPWWNPDYVPLTPQVWAVPGIGCILYIAVHLYWLLRSATSSSDDIGMGDAAISLITFMSCFGTLVAMVILWAVEKYVTGLVPDHDDCYNQFDGVPRAALHGVDPLPGQ
jgi:hypothetical protein